MLELLMSANTTGPYVSVEYPNSGPGNKWLLAGTPALGYFGVIPDAELMSYVSYKNYLSPSLVITMTSYSGWFKFFYKGKVIYMSCRAIGHTVSWQTIYQAGGVYGTNNTGTFPSGTPRNQYKPIALNSGGKQWSLVPRLPHANDVDGGDVAGRAIDTFEYNSLMGRLIGRTNIIDVNYSAWYGSWAKFDHVELDMNKTNLGMDTGNASNRDRSTGRGGLGVPLNGVQPVKTFAADTVVLRGTLELEGYIEPF